MLYVCTSQRFCKFIFLIMLDKLGKEIYDGDVLLSNGENKFRVIWSNETNAWHLEEKGKLKPFNTNFIATTTRLYNFYEKS
ncbi:hypothetical protein MNBD_BACTEROID06-501 [hydrothermal vent metagenome]|uniref:Uncharacterized protein n=1 Tax=hydrothermal vent metagenome TaxID=652676 RepID=A0A3B0US07_9ZZZZ